MNKINKEKCISKDLYICLTYRHVFFSLWLSLTKPERESEILICSNHQNITDEAINICHIHDLGIKVKFIDEKKIHGLFAKDNILSKLPYIGRYFRVDGFRIKTIFDYIEDDTPVSKFSDLYIFHDQNIISKHYLRKSKAVLIEDGKVNYAKTRVTPGIIKPIYRFILGCNPKYRVIGDHPKICKILLTNPNKSLCEVSHKVLPLYNHLNFDACVINQLTLSFNIDSPELSYDADNVMLLTQPLDWAGFCTTEEKVNIYIKICEYLVSKGKTVYIKPHPKEEPIDYECCLSFIGGRILNAKAPLEVLSFVLYDYKVEYISLLTSSEIFECNKFKSVKNLVDDLREWKADNFEKIKELALESIKKDY